MNSFRIGLAVDHLHQGGLIACPTEAVWGLSCDPFNSDAVRNLLTLKQRPVEKGLILVAADFQQLQPFVHHLSKEQHDSLLSTWPGPTTWIVPANHNVPVWVSGGQSGIALRVSAHPVIQQLCKAYGPLVSTSANPAGKHPARNLLDVQCYFNTSRNLRNNNNHVMVVPGSLGDSKRPTVIKDLVSGETLRA